MPVSRATLLIVAALGLGVGLAAGLGAFSGGGSQDVGGSQGRRGPSPGQASTAATVPHGPPGRFVARVRADTHRPRPGAHWSYEVRARDGRGRSFSATVVVRVIQGRRVLDTLGWFSFRGVVRHSYRWPAALTGSSAALEATVLGPGGTRTVRYPVLVQPATAGQPGFRARLRGATHRPRAGHAWRYEVSAVAGGGRRFAGTAMVRVVLNGRVIDTVGWFGFRGALHRTYRWPASLRGLTAVFEARVVGSGGARTVRYPVTVRR
jgi:hypothetical protein